MENKGNYNLGLNRKILYAFFILSFCYLFGVQSKTVQSIVVNVEPLSEKTNTLQDTTIQLRFSTPVGYKRINVEEYSFAHYIRNFHLLPKNSSVRLYNGKLKYNQDIHEAILDIDVGEKNLQQCADAVMRLRAEYFFAKKEYDRIFFNFTNGWKADYKTWRTGKRIRVEGNKSYWVSSNNEHTSYGSFRDYMELVFMYAGTLSLSKEMKQQSLEDIKIGDVFIRGGSPGHAVIVVDVAINSTGKKVVLLAQSYMPAQQIHVLKNLNSRKLSPWYSVHEMKDGLSTPEWYFEASELKKFED